MPKKPKNSALLAARAKVELASMRARERARQAGQVDFLTEAEAARLMHVSVETLGRLRRRGEGPAFYRIVRSILYQRADVETWLAARRQQPAATKEDGSAARQRRKRVSIKRLPELRSQKERR